MSNPPPTTYGGQSGGNQASGGASSAQAGASPLGGRTNTAQECAVCERAKACCLALAAVQFADPAPCLTLTTNCELFSGMPGEAILTACKTYITQRTSSGLPACQDQP
jgi:hypothetical protein